MNKAPGRLSSGCPLEARLPGCPRLLPGRAHSSYATVLNATVNLENYFSHRFLSPSNSGHSPFSYVYTQMIDPLLYVMLLCSTSRSKAMFFPAPPRLFTDLFHVKTPASLSLKPFTRSSWYRLSSAYLLL